MNIDENKIKDLIQTIEMHLALDCGKMVSLERSDIVAIWHGLQELKAVRKWQAAKASNNLDTILWHEWAQREEG